MALRTSSGNFFPPSSADEGSQTPSMVSPLASPLQAADENESTRANATNCLSIIRNLLTAYLLARLGGHAVLGGHFQELSKGSAANSLGFPNFYMPQEFTRPLKQLFWVGQLRPEIEPQVDIVFLCRNVAEMLGLLRADTVTSHPHPGPRHFHDIRHDGRNQRTELVGQLACMSTCLHHCVLKGAVVIDHSHGQPLRE